MAQVLFIRQNQAGNAHIDGASPSYLPTSLNRPRKVGICKHICKQNFVLIAPSMRVPNMAVQQAEGGWQWQTHLETGFCPHHQALA